MRKKRVAGCAAGYALAAAFALCATALPAQGQSLDIVPVPSGGFAGSAAAISGDGTTVVGSYVDGTTFYARGFRWQSGGTSEDIGYLGMPVAGTAANAVSHDGSVVVGSSASQAFRWTAGTGIVAIPFLPDGFSSAAFGVSGDGSIVVGRATSTAFTINGGQAFYWSSATGSVALGTLDTLVNFAANSAAFAISANGQVIVGQSTSDQYAATGEAFRWQNGTMIGLGTLTGPGAFAFSIARAVNADGSVIVGQSSSLMPGVWAEAFRWTQATGTMTGLGVLNAGDDESGALAVSADGSVVVGYSGFSLISSNTAFRWTQADGMQSVQDLLSAAGVDVANWSLQRATGISADGTVIVGEGTNPDGESVPWIVRFTPQGTGMITPAVIAQSFASLAPLTQGAVGRADAQTRNCRPIGKRSSIIPARHACSIMAPAARCRAIPSALARSESRAASRRTGPPASP